MLLERDQELRLLGDLVAETDSSGGKVVLLRGEAGIGKSALVREFTRVHADRAHVHLGSCDDLLTPRPLGPFWDIARDLPSLAQPLENGDRPAALEAVLDLLSGALRPRIMVIEDTHWADEATLDAIKYLGRRIAKTRGLLLLTYRDGEVDYDHPLRGVIGDLPPDSVVRIQLGGLSLLAVSSIIGSSNKDPREVLAATNGNPFLVTEMASSNGDTVPSSVQDSVMARVQKLSPEAYEMLKFLSVIPERIPTVESLRLTGATENQLAECERRGLLHLEGEFVAFRHELIRQAVEASLTSSERVATNSAILEALPPETTPARLVHHARQARDISRLVELAPKAARAALAVGSHREAVDHFRQLTSHLDRLDPDARGPILAEWSKEEFLLGNTIEAINLIERALSEHRKVGDQKAESVALAVQAAHLYEIAGQRDRAEQLARQAVTVLGADPDGSDLAIALDINAYLAMMALDVTSTLELVDQTLEAAGPDIDELILIRSLNHRGCALNLENYPKGRASLDEARDRSEAGGQWYEEVRALFNHAWAASSARDLPIASDYVQRAIASAIRHELAGLVSHANSLHARVLELKGE